jgi:hypothetical protein
MYPKNRWKKPNTKVTGGAHGFNKEIIPKLKYNNPALEIEIQNFPKSPSLLRLHFQCQDQEQLRNIATPSQRPANTDFPHAETDRTLPPNFGDPKAPRPTAADDEITLREISASSDLPQPMYQRSVTLSLRDRPMYNIMDWFQQRTKCEKIPISLEDVKLGSRLGQQAIRSEMDRERMKIAQAAIDREKAVLEQAKRIAEQNAAEAAASA